MMRIFLVVWLAVFAVVPFIATSCSAQEDQRDWVRPTVREAARQSCEWWGNCYQWYKYKAWRERQAQVRSWHQSYHDRDWRPTQSETRFDREHCHSRAIEVLSGPHKSEDTAIKDAWKRWMEQVAFERGNVYQEPNNSKQRRILCAPVDASTSWMASVSRGAGRLYQGAIKGNLDSDGRNMACMLSALPCRENYEWADPKESKVRGR